MKDVLLGISLILVAGCGIAEGMVNWFFAAIGM